MNQVYWMLLAILLLLAGVICLCVRLAVLRTRLKASEAQRSAAEERTAQVAKEEAAARQEALESQKEAFRDQIDRLQTTYREQLAQLHDAQQEALNRQIETVRAALTADTEKMLRDREETLSRKADETFSKISDSMGKDFLEMKQAFDANKQQQTQSSVSLKVQIDEAVKHLRMQTESIGDKADRLASALRGQHKMQGCWGETILQNIFRQENLLEGRDYDREDTLRDEAGEVVANDDTGRRMRPDFILHYPDQTDIIVDAKVSLNALADWFGADNDNDRENAAQRNLTAVKDQIRNLSSKRYQSHLRNGRKTLGYVLMFVPNQSAFQLAKTLEPNIFNEAFQQNVLIVTEESIMPLLRIIRTAWVCDIQMRSQEKIIASAQKMLDRVADFCEAHAQVRKKLQEAIDIHDKSSAKLRDNGQSIVKAANELVKLGVPLNPKKRLPDVDVPYAEAEEVTEPEGVTEPEENQETNE